MPRVCPRQALNVVLSEGNLPLVTQLDNMSLVLQEHGASLCLSSNHALGFGIRSDCKHCVQRCVCKHKRTAAPSSKLGAAF